MNYSSRYEHKQRSIVRQNQLASITANAIADFKAGNITINELWKRGTFEKAGYWFECCGIMNCNDGQIESGRIIRIMSNWEYLTRVTYRGDSTVIPYLCVYYVDSLRVEVKRCWTKFKWSDEIIAQLFDVEFIAIIREHGSKFLNRKMDRVMKILCFKYPDLNLTDLA